MSSTIYVVFCFFLGKCGNLGAGVRTKVFIGTKLREKFCKFVPSNENLSQSINCFVGEKSSEIFLFSFDHVILNLLASRLVELLRVKIESFCYWQLKWRKWQNVNSEEYWVQVQKNDPLNGSPNSKMLVRCIEESYFSECLFRWATVFWKVISIPKGCHL